ncbi:MAG: 3-isopropylmalate dehydrogenase [Firmicutes bacterium]|jgi:3-isopropylmalate dehydrogenase|uniref:3-isopropylmalate dehydrogenase n=1 Tax=Sulfobacillus benefaciens TaxID=453960 RepID=A0A2T2X325_9FIRM|nr:3-isopropylmalate dehydrogenase [Bacillota bacterium]MCL5014533.1 3-isopropylmalate dehydrogenase [Bacillota bacterium]PSR28879.1 MAG: 3-isopropylmalate dehydrogenase [Sulfobacillus benefaciens]
MATHQLLVLPGDGIGPEVTEAAMRVLDVVAEFGGWAVEKDEADIGGRAIDQSGDPFPSDTRRKIDKAEAVMLGAVGGPRWDQAPKRPEAGLLAMRQYMGLWANLRPFRVFPGLEHLSPLKNAAASGIVFRELTGGLYFGEPRGRRFLPGDLEVVDTLRYRQSEIRRIIELAFQYARDNHLTLTSVDKANVLESSRVWREVANELAQQFPDVPLTHRYVDAAAMELVLNPERYQVIVTENLFGDILSDLTGGLVGSLGLLGSSSVAGTPGTRGLFEPVHGSAPDIAGKGIANPTGAMLSAAYLIGWSWSQPEAQHLIEEAVAESLAEGPHTPDLGGTASTEEFTQTVIQRVKNIVQRRKIS